MLKRFTTYLFGYSIPLMIILPFYPQYDFYSGVSCGFITGFICASMLFIFNWLIGRLLK